MTKKAVIACFLLFISSLIYAVELEATAEAFPTSVSFSWNPVEGAVYYDVYNGEAFLSRLDAGARAYTAVGLLSDTDYSFSIAARTSDNETIAAAFLDVETGSWDGIYEWVNMTDDDNDGKMAWLRIRVDTDYDEAVGQYHNIYMIMEDGSEVKIFPLYDFGDPKSGQWESYKGDGTAATAYRLNADRLNTSIINPSKWRLDSITLGPDHGSAHVETRAFGITADIIASYRLFVEDGIMKMEYSTAGSGAAEAILFCNPNPGEGDSFVLVRQDIPQDSI